MNWSDALCSGAAWFPARVAMGIKAALPKYEIYIYNTVLCLAVLWSASWISEVSSCEYRAVGGEGGAHTQKVIKHSLAAVDEIAFMICCALRAVKPVWKRNIGVS